MMTVDINARRAAIGSFCAYVQIISGITRSARSLSLISHLFTLYWDLYKFVAFGICVLPFIVIIQFLPVSSEVCHIYFIFRTHHLFAYQFFHVIHHDTYGTSSTKLCYQVNSILQIKQALVSSYPYFLEW